MKTIFASVLMCCSLAAYAEGESNTENMPVDNQESDVGKFNIVLAAAMTFGGDELVPVSNGRSIDAGGLLYLAAGGVYHAGTSVDIQATFGVHVDAVEATNGSADFTRSFVELMPFYVFDSGNRFGVGIAHIMSPELTTPTEVISFEDTNGMVVEYDWMLAKHYFLGIRLADITYDDTNGIYLPVDGSYIGVIMEGHF